MTAAAAPPNGQDQITRQNAAELAGRYIQTIPPWPGGYEGRGIVTCAGGLKYNTCAWVLVRMLRQLGCTLPIQVWHLGGEERDEQWADLVRPYGVECIDASEVERVHPHPRLAGWPLKPYSILHSPFQEVLFLDADNVPVVDPSYLLDDPRYLACGAIFWPDGWPTPPQSERWRVFGVPYGDHSEQESGQIAIDKRKCWAALNLCNWYNERSDFFYQVVYGDKDTFRFAWRRLGQPYAMPAKHPDLPHTICQQDLDGRLVFQHRFGAKWRMRYNRRVPGFLHEEQCLAFVEDLRRRWRPLQHFARRSTPADCRRMRALAGAEFQYVRVGHNGWPMALGEDGVVDRGRSRDDSFWWIEGGSLWLAGIDGRATARFEQQPDGRWEGRNLRDPRMRLRLAPQT